MAIRFPSRPHGRIERDSARSTGGHIDRGSGCGVSGCDVVRRGRENICLIGVILIDKNGIVVVQRARDRDRLCNRCRICAGMSDRTRNVAVKNRIRSGSCDRPPASAAIT